MNLYFPINAAVATIFYVELKNTGYLNNLSSLYSKPQDLKIPILNITGSISDNDVLFQQDLSKYVDLKQIAKTIRKRQSLYLNEAQKDMNDLTNVENWFSDYDNWAIGLTFILSIVGAIAAIIAIYTCIRSHKFLAIMGTVMSQAQPTNANELGIVENENYITDGLSDKVFQTTLIIILYGMYKLARYLYIRWSAIKTVVPEAMAMQKGPVSHLHLEFGSLNTGLTKVYLGSLYMNICDLYTVGQLSSITCTPTKSRWRTHGILKLAWNHDLFTLFYGDSKLPLPDYAYVALWTLSKLSLIFTEVYAIRLLCTHEGLTYVLTTDTTAGTPNAMPHSDTSRKPKNATFNPVPHSSTQILALQQPSHTLTLNEMVALGIQTDTAT